VKRKKKGRVRGTEKEEGRWKKGEGEVEKKERENG
jgi:hypothetical protein